MKKQKLTFRSAGYELVGILGSPEKLPAPGVVLFHGLSNSKEDCPLINETSEMLEREGYVTFRFDFFGSGESPGEMKDKKMSILEQNAKDAVNFLSQSKAVSGGIGLCGRSLGGTFVILLAGHPSVKASVIASGGVSLQKVFAPFDRLKALEKELEEKEGKKLPGTGRYKGSYDLGNGWFKELPQFDDKIEDCLGKLSHVLVLGTTPDVKAPLEEIIAVFNAAKEPKKIQIFENVDHDYKGVEAEAIELERQWFKKYLPID
jgi:esterase/lipase